MISLVSALLIASHSCPEELKYIDTEPAIEQRTVTLPQWKLSVTIPKNFRAVRRQNGTVEFLHPADFVALQCFVQKKTSVGRGYDALGLKLSRRPPTYTPSTPYQTPTLTGIIATNPADNSFFFVAPHPSLRRRWLEVFWYPDSHADLQTFKTILNNLNLQLK